MRGSALWLHSATSEAEPRNGSEEVERPVHVRTPKRERDRVSIMAMNPRDMDGFSSLLSTTDIKKKVNLGVQLLNYLADPSKSIECQDIGHFIDNTIPWLASSNPKVSRLFYLRSDAPKQLHSSEIPGYLVLFPHSYFIFNCLRYLARLRSRAITWHDSCDITERRLCHSDTVMSRYILIFYSLWYTTIHLLHLHNHLTGSALRIYYVGKSGL